MTTTFVPGAGGGTQYADGTTQATPEGTVALGKNPSNVLHAVSLDSSGNLNVNLAAGSISGNAAAGPTGSAVPASADYTGFNSGGNLVGVSSANPLPVSLANTGANATAVKVDGSAVTQPVSAASLPLPTGAATSAKQPALGTAGTASADVITVQGIASMTALKVDGSGVTQPVSGTVTANQGTANTAANAWPHKVTDGTNTAAVKAASTAAAATDPALVVAVSPNNSVAVTGTFFQATQPVSGTVTANQGTANTAANAWPAKVTDGTNVAAVKAASTAAAATDPALVVAVSPNNSVAVTQATAANLNATVVGPTLTKGTQGSTGFSVQELKDAGRTQLTFYVDSLTGITTEALATLNITKGGAAQSTSTSYTVTAGKTLRLQCLNVAVVASTTTAVACRVRVRTAASSISASSPVIVNAATATPAAVADVGGSLNVDIPDGLEIAGGNQIAISHIESSAVTGSTTTGTGVSFCLVGYEY